VPDKETRITRSARRTRTVGVREREGYYEILAPLTISDQELKPIVDKLIQRLERRRVKKSLDNSDLDNARER